MTLATISYLIAFLHTVQSKNPPAKVHQLLEDTCMGLVLWQQQIQRDQEQARNRRIAQDLVDNPQKSLAHPGPECECSQCLRNGDYL